MLMVASNHGGMCKSCLRDMDHVLCCSHRIELGKRVADGCGSGCGRGAKPIMCGPHAAVIARINH